MIDLADTAGFLVGPIAAILIAPVCLIGIGLLTWQQRRWAELALGVTLAAAVLAAWIVYWQLWNPTFIYLDDDRKVPTALHYWSVTAQLTTMLGVPTLCALLTYSVFRSRRSRRGSQGPVSSE